MADTPEVKDVILKFEAQTEKANAKIREMEQVLKSSSGRALAEAKGRVKALEDQVKSAAKAAAAGWGQIGGAIAAATSKVQSMMGPINQIIGLYHMAARAVDFLSKQLDKVLFSQKQNNKEAAEYWRIIGAIKEREKRDEEREDRLKGIQSQFGGVSRSLAERIAGHERRGARAGVYGGLTAGDVELDRAIALAEKSAADEQRARDLAFLKGRSAGMARRANAVAAPGRGIFESASLGGFAQSLSSGIGDVFGAAGGLVPGSGGLPYQGLASPADTMRLQGYVAAAAGGPQVEGLDRTAETMRMLADSTNLAGAAFGSFTNSIAAGVDAAIAGGEGIGKAMRRAAAMSLRATAVESSVMAVKETAWALSSLAFTDGKGASLHFASAAKHAATAILAGAGSAALGGGGGGGGAGGGGGYSGGPGGGFINAGAGQQQQGTTIYLNMSGIVGNQDEVAATIVRAIQGAERKGRFRN